MEQDLKPGDLVFLSSAYEAYMFEKNPQLKISIINRLAKVEEIIDWGSEKGRKIKQARKKSGKWKDLPIEENKYILSIFYHELIGRSGQKGVVERGVPMFRYHPKKKKVAFFDKAPDWIYREISKKCESFGIEDKKD